MDTVRKESTVRRPETKRAEERFVGQKGTPAIRSGGKLEGLPRIVSANPQAGDRWTSRNSRLLSWQPPCLESLADKREAFCNLPPACEQRIKIAIVDDDARTRGFIRRILEQSGEFSCAGCYSSG